MINDWTVQADGIGPHMRPYDLSEVIETILVEYEVLAEQR